MGRYKAKTDCKVDTQYGVYVDRTFKEALFESYLAHKQIPWPRLDSGRLALIVIRLVT